MDVGRVVATLVVIILVSMFIYANDRPFVKEYDLFDLVLLEFDPADYYVYFIYNESLYSAPVVLPLVERDVLIADLALNTTVRMPAGVYVAVPRWAFKPQPPSVPKGTRGRLVDLEVPGLGVARLVLARNSTELPGVAANMVYVYVNAEEKNGKLYVAGRPLDVRKPRIRGEPPRGQDKRGISDIGIAAVAETATGTTVSYWASYVFAPASPANIAIDGYDTGYKAIRYFNLTIGQGGEFVEASARGQRYTGNKTVWAYLGYGVSEVWVFYSGTANSTLWYKVCADSAPNPRPPSSISDSRCSAWLAATATSTGGGYVARLSMSQWSNNYIWFYADVYSTRPINGSIAVVYQRPAPSTSNVYGLMHGVWWSSAVQPGQEFNAYYFINVNRLMFTFRIPPGADIFFMLSGLRVTTCGGYSSLTVSVYVPTRPDLKTSATSTSRTWTGLSDCYTYTFPTISGVLRKEAVAPILAGNATAIPVVLEFSPTLKPYAGVYSSQPVTVAFSMFHLQGWRWPEIWRHDAQNWRSDVLYPNVNRPVKFVLRDVLAYTVWALQHPLNKSATPPTGYPAMAYVVYAHSADSQGGINAPFSRSALEYAYHTQYDVKLVRVCNALEMYSDGGVGGITIFVDQPGYNPNFEYYVSVASSVVSNIGHAVTLWSLLTVLNLVPGGQVATVASYALWGIGLALQLFQPSGIETCNPSTQYVSNGYKAGTGYVKSAAWRIATNYPYAYSGAKRVSVQGMVITEFNTKIGPATTGLGIYTPLITYYYYSDDTYFSGPFEPYVYGWSRYYVKIG